MLSLIGNPDLQLPGFTRNHQVNLLPGVIAVAVRNGVHHALADRDSDFVLIVLVEAHPNPLIAKSDGFQGLFPEQLRGLVKAAREVWRLRKTTDRDYVSTLALERTYAAMPAPKWVVAVGDCGCGCGVFEGSYAVIGAVDKVIPVDLHIRGCPPRPIDLLKGLIALMKRATGGDAKD